MLYSQVLVYGLYWFIIEQYALQYPYMLLVYPGFSGEDYSYFNIFNGLCNSFVLLIVVPLFSNFLEMDDSLICTACLWIMTVAFVGQAFSKTLWELYINAVSFKYN